MNYFKRSIMLIFLFLPIFNITSKSRENSISLIPILTTSNFTENDVILLAKLINSESGGESYYGKMAVANVVINRAKLTKSSIRSVIYAKKQFCGVKTKKFKETPTMECIIAAKYILAGNTFLPDNIYYFLNPKNAAKKWKKKIKHKLFIKIGNHNFYTI